MHLAHRRFNAGFGFLLIAALVLIGQPLQAKADADLLEKQQRQREIQEETDRTVRQMKTMIRVVQFYQLEQNEEQQLLQEAASVLARLSREQMNAVIVRLEKAAQAPSAETADSEKALAYAKHREIVTTLRALLAKRDAVRSLEEAAARLEEMAKRQRDMYLTAAPIVRLIAEPELMQVDPSLKRSIRSYYNVMKLLSNHELDLGAEVQSLLEEQLPALEPELLREQKQGLRKALALAETLDIVENFDLVRRRLKRSGSQDDRLASYQLGVELQWQVSGDLQKVAYALRSGQDELSLLRSAKDRLDEILAVQTSVRGQTESAEPRTVQTRLMVKQGRLAQETRDLKSLLETVTESTSEALNASVTEMRNAEEQLQRLNPSKATDPQQSAENSLLQAREQLESVIAAEEKKREDPVAALKDAIDSIDEVIAAQKETQKETEQTEKDEDVAKLASKQEELAKRTNQLAQEPLPGKERAEPSLKKAETAMREAASNLADKNKPDAQEQQEKALTALAKAKKALEDKVAEIEKRREEIAALEKAKEELESLIREEKKVADDARAMDDTKDSPQLAKKQEELTPAAQDLAKELEASVPEAAKKVDASTENMEQAKKALDEKTPTEAAKQADEATKKLEQAKTEVTKALDAKKVGDALDQAAMQPETVTPSGAAQQVAKALEQVQEAQAQAKEAMKTPEADLAQLQKEVADQAAKMKLDDAGVPAKQAAEALQKGELNQAVEQQQKALEQLQQAATEAKPMQEGEPTEGENTQTEQAKGAEELAKKQEALLDATKALAKSQKATEAAQGAVAQAKAQAPQGVQTPLEQASQQLEKASQQLAKQEPGAASQAQAEAASQLAQALQTLNAAATAMGQPTAQPGQTPTAVASAAPPNPSPGQSEGEGQAQPGQGQPRQGMGQTPSEGQSNEQNVGTSEGDRIPGGKASNSASELLKAQGKGAFIHLPPHQRELIRQALEQKLPPEYAAMIQQYYLNIAKRKAQSR